MAFHEQWYTDRQVELLERLARYARQLDGLFIEVGCWEGKSTVALANAIHPHRLIAVDWWRGNVTEDEDHETVQILRERDVYAVFEENIRTMTRGNVDVRRMDCFEFLAALDAPVALCHVDAAHDYGSVKRTLELVRPHMLPGGVLCGDDWFTSCKPRLGGGVQKACLETLTDVYATGNFWFWRNAA